MKNKSTQAAKLSKKSQYKYDSLFCAGSFIPTNVTISGREHVEVLEASFGGSRMVIRCIEVKTSTAPFVAVDCAEQPLLNEAVQMSEMCGEGVDSLKAVTNYNTKTQAKTFYYPVAVLAQLL